MNSSHKSQEIPFSLNGKRVWVAGHTGMVGSALVRRLQRENCEILKVSRSELDLTRQYETEQWMAAARPEVIFVAAAKVGGIAANAAYPADFLYTNTLISMNIMKSAADIGVEKLLWMGSSCIYPKFAAQPITENALLTGPLEPTNEAYAIAKIAALKLSQFYSSQYGLNCVSVMPTNIYGLNDNFDPQSSHVIPAMIRRMHEAKISGQNKIVLWGTGSPLREFLHVDDLADACCFLMKSSAHFPLINIGSGREISIRNLAHLIAGIVGYDGQIVFDTSKPDGAPRKLLDCSRLNALGWNSTVELRYGIQDLYEWWRQPKSLQSDMLRQAAR
ncbi:MULTISPECIES: GDP-L-fucose synthase family protein [Rhizobium/Agrobacterium group]|jgi:GDP-L-fucose synthase|uniref:GDP-L-fucose synthase family protein n=1 Tax=Rhizobium/Agrobacterium group TaxID=227290 RepID=UPI00129AEB97|nr:MULTISPECIES: GDP-L-fucose synthase [Rhizobium/Agrobacterium group]NTA59994.1 GDP-L-fucose synthase [Agrobacterium tumefaciens]NTC84671.1 GDP-L-fucose synthase [Agrobacterium tumefaciens]NTD09335.1 GDP-L-fucose synthase [Agrobacterium tumefaciens]UXU06538.1 GDP-L-fucose synthase [Agrobacterium tumefaciens]